jgi:hypothetical protein
MSTIHTNRVTAAKRENNRVECKSNGEEMLRPRVCLLQVNDFGSRPVREVARELEIDGEPSGCGKDADHPINQSQADGTRLSQNSASFM